VKLIWPPAAIEMKPPAVMTSRLDDEVVLLAAAQINRRL